MHEVKIHLIHGSTRKNKASRKSTRLFGILGGHVLIQLDDKVYSFSYVNKINRIWPRKKDKNGQFKIEAYPEWIEKVNWEKRTTFVTQINDFQFQRMFSLIRSYTRELPFDYAFFGERCCSIHYKLLRESNIVKRSWLLKLYSIFPTLYIHLFKQFMISPVLQVEKVKGCQSRFWV